MNCSVSESQGAPICCKIVPIEVCLRKTDRLNEKDAGVCPFFKECFSYSRHTEEVAVGYGDSETESDEDGSESDDDYDLDSVRIVCSYDFIILRFLRAIYFCDKTLQRCYKDSVEIKIAQIRLMCSLLNQHLGTT